MNNNNQQSSAAQVITMSNQKEAQEQAFADASTSGAPVFLCHIYEQGNRKHLTFSLPFNQLLQMAKLNSAKTKENKNDAEQYVNRPLIRQHVDDIAKYLLETDNYILPPFVFNSSTPIKVFAFGTGAVQFGYAVIPSNVVLYVTDGQHRLKAIEKAIEERQSLRNDSVTVLVVQEEDIDQIHQDFADCAKNKPIPPALLATFDTSNILSKLTRKINKTLVIFDGRIDKISKNVGKDPNNLFTMNQLRVGMAEFLFGSSRKQVIESRSEQSKEKYELLLGQAQKFYMIFAQHNETWKLLLEPASATVNLDLYSLRQERIDFNTVGFQIISRVGHYIFFKNSFDEEKQKILTEILASLDFHRNAPLWKNSVIMEDSKGQKRIIAQMAAINRAVKEATVEVEKLSDIQLAP